MLYEMVAGRLPFEGERQEAITYGITNEEPEPVTALRAGLPLELEWIIGKALAKDRQLDSYPSIPSGESKAPVSHSFLSSGR